MGAIFPERKWKVAGQGRHQSCSGYLCVSNASLHYHYLSNWLQYPQRSSMLSIKRLRNRPPRWYPRNWLRLLLRPFPNGNNGNLRLLLRHPYSANNFQLRVLHPSVPRILFLRSSAKQSTHSRTTRRQRNLMWCHPLQNNMHHR